MLDNLLLHPRTGTPMLVRWRNILCEATTRVDCANEESDE
jgi:hypothetical protein